jgi:hypothetical protein
MDIQKAQNSEPCQKKCFKTRKAAKEFMKKLNTYKKAGLTDVYKCDECLSWHLTSMNKKDSRKYTRFLNNNKNNNNE